MRLMQLGTGGKHSADEIAADLSRVTGHHLDSNVYFFDHRTDLTDKLAAAAGIDLSRQVLTKKQINQIMAGVKKPRS